MEQRVKLVHMVCTIALRCTLFLLFLIQADRGFATSRLCTDGTILAHNYSTRFGLVHRKRGERSAGSGLNNERFLSSASLIPRSRSPLLLLLVVLSRVLARLAPLLLLLVVPSPVLALAGNVAVLDVVRSWF